MTGSASDQFQRILRLIPLLADDQDHRLDDIAAGIAQRILRRNTESAHVEELLARPRPSQILNGSNPVRTVRVSGLRVG